MTTKPLKTLTSLSILLFAAAMTSACNIDAKDMAEDLEDHFSIDDELDLDGDGRDNDTQNDDRGNDTQKDEMPIIEGEWFGTLTVDEEVFEVYFELEQEDDFAIGFGGYQSWFFDADNNWYAGVYLFEVDVEITSSRGIHTLDFDPSNCMASIDGEYYALDCDAPFVLSMTDDSSMEGSLNDGRVFLTQ